MAVPIMECHVLYIQWELTPASSPIYRALDAASAQIVAHSPLKRAPSLPPNKLVIGANKLMIGAALITTFAAVQARPACTAVAPRTTAHIPGACVHFVCWFRNVAPMP